MTRITNKELSNRFNINLAKIRRWTREFLPPDTRATRQSGYTREFSIEEAFDIMLGGHLVRALGFLVSEAKVIIKDLKPILKMKGLYPDRDLNRVLEENMERYFKIRIMVSRRLGDLKIGCFHYEIREQISGSVSKGEKNVYEEKYRREWIGPKDSYPDFFNIRVLVISIFLRNFIALLTSDKGVQKIPLTGLELKEGFDYFMSEMIDKEKK